MIDNCRYTFPRLASDVLPEYMAELRRRMKRPMRVSELAANGVGVGALLRQLNLKSDFPGCYVLMDGTRPIYVGISHAVFHRVRQHIRGTTHFDASLAYRIAARGYPHNKTRSAAMADSAFRVRFEKARKYLRGLNVAFIEIANPLELYLFEAFCAMKLDTSSWNTFETH